MSDNHNSTPLRRLYQSVRARVAPFAAALRLTLGITAAALLVIGVLGVHREASASQTTAPNAAGADQTLRDFLTQAVVDQNAYVACQYLTWHEQERVFGLVPSATGCRFALTTAPAGIGGVSSLHGVNGLKLHTVVRGDRAWITATGPNTPPLRFTLARTTPSEYVPFEAPAAAWRITSGVRGLLIPPAARASSPSRVGV